MIFRFGKTPIVVGETHHLWKHPFTRGPFHPGSVLPYITGPWTLVDVPSTATFRWNLESSRRVPQKARGFDPLTLGHGRFFFNKTSPPPKKKGRSTFGFREFCLEKNEQIEFSLFFGIFVWKKNR